MGEPGRQRAQRSQAGALARYGSILRTHLEVLGLGAPHAAPRVERLRASFVGALSDLDPALLERRTAGVLLGLALWPLRSQRPGWSNEVRDLP